MRLRLTASYVLALRRHSVVAGTLPAQMLASTLDALRRATTLPQMGDEPVLIPPAMAAWSRPIPNTVFELVYVLTNVDAAIFTLRIRRPTAG